MVRWKTKALGDPATAGSPERVVSESGPACARWGRFRAPVMPSGPVVTRRWARAGLVTAVVGYVVFFGVATWISHDRFNTSSFDLGIYDQGLWLMSRFKSPFITVMGRHLFGDHTSFILMLLVPLYWVAASAKVLLVVQALVLGISAWPVFLIVRDVLRDERLAVLLSVAFLLQPALGWTNYEQFHPDVFAVPLLLFAFWFMLRRRWVGFSVFVGLAMLVKEDVPLLTFMLGLYVAVRYSRKVGLITSAVSVIYFVFAVYVVLRHFNGVGTLNAWRIPFGGPGGLIHTAFTDPLELGRYLVGEGRPRYLWQLMAPLALIPLLAPEVLLISILPMASNLLSTFQYQHSIRYHYGTLILPTLILAAAVGISRFRIERIRAVLSIAILTAACLGAYASGPLPLSRYNGLRDAIALPSPASIEKAIEVIPPDAVVASYYRYVPHLTHREGIYEFPNPFRTRNWGVEKEPGRRLPQAATVEYLILPADLGDGVAAAPFDEVRTEFKTIYSQGGVVVLRRSSDWKEFQPTSSTRGTGSLPPETVEPLISPPSTGPFRWRYALVPPAT